MGNGLGMLGLSNEWKWRCGSMKIKMEKSVYIIKNKKKEREVRCMSSPGNRLGEFPALPAGGSLKECKKGGALRLW